MMCLTYFMVRWKTHQSVCKHLGQKGVEYYTYECAKLPRFFESAALTNSIWLVFQEWAIDNLE